MQKTNSLKRVKIHIFTIKNVMLRQKIITLKLLLNNRLLVSEFLQSEPEIRDL